MTSNFYGNFEELFSRFFVLDYGGNVRISKVVLSSSSVQLERVGSLMCIVRGQKVMLDRDLAVLYGVATKALNQAVKRHSGRFPLDFMFRLSTAETRNLRRRLQIIDSGSRMGIRRRPRAFTEQGVAMLSSVINSERAVQVNIAIMRAFVRLRRVLSENTALARRLEAMEGRLDRYKSKMDEEVQAVWEVIGGLMSEEEAPKDPIGFRPP
ncbi:MAG: ORF6N domain-containing protein [Elusimicrobiota bacterium]